MTEDYVKVARVSDIPVGGRKLVEFESVRIAIFNLDGKLYAIEDTCTHDGGPLVEGDVLNGCQIECPRHGACFDIRTGAALSMPAFTATNAYAVEIVGDDIFVEKPY
jgi:3-phenylpropionate/trans-cinnamate dioxygenase ferredoxin subunit